MTARRSLGSRRRLALATLLLVAVLATAARAVSVGDAERRLGDDDDDDDDDDEFGCPQATTLARVNGTTSKAATSALVTTPQSCDDPDELRGESVATKGNASERLVELDARKLGIERVASIPTGVQVLRLDNNTVEYMRPGSGGANATTQIYLSNNSITSLDDFVFPSALLTLDLTLNLIEEIDNASFPATLKMLNLTRNPIKTLQSVRLPPKLHHLNLAGAGLERLENFSFPSSIKSLNFSGNFITRISGVIFPAALTQLAIKVGYAMSSSRTSLSSTSTAVASTRVVAGAAAAASSPLVFAQPAVDLEEFEVRRTDADRFKKLQVFDVSKTTAVKCSDPLAKNFYVNDTMLCVLSDADFLAKYAHVVSAAGSGSGEDSDPTLKNKTTTPVTPRPLLHETWHQSRSWFLVVGAATLGGFVLVVAIGGCIHASARRATRAYNARKSEFAKSRAKRSAEDAPTQEKEVVEQETDLLLALEHDESGDGTEVSTSDGTSSGVFNTSADQRLAGLVIAPAALNYVLALPSEPSALFTAGQAGKDVSGFAYALAKVNNRLVVAKTLRVRRRRPKKHVGFDNSDGGAAAISRDRDARGSSMRDFMREIHLHSTLTHANVVRFVGFVRGPWNVPERAEDMDSADSLTLVSEYMDKGSLENLIVVQKTLLREALGTQRGGVEITDEAMADPSLDVQVWSWQDDSASRKSKLSVAVDVARALVYLHSFEPSLFHGNFSSRKVLLDDAWHVKLNDLSCCSALQRWSERQGSDPSSSSSSAVTTKWNPEDEVRMDMTVWTAPEVIDGQQYTTKADMYSFGILLSYLDTYEFPVEQLSRVDSEVAILSTSNYNGIPIISGERSPASVRMLAMNCLSFQPEERPSAQEALNELLATQLDLAEASSASTLEGC